MNHPGKPLRRLTPRPIAMFAAGLTALCIGCGDSSDPAAPDPDPPPPDGIVTDHTTPAALIAAYAEAMSAKDFDASAALLHADFEFQPRDIDVDDFPWMTGDTWDRTQELAILANMFNPDFSGAEAPVDRINLIATVQSSQDLGGGSHQTTAVVEGIVLVNATDGWSFDTRLIFQLVTVDGFLRIRKIQEIDRLLAGRSSEASSFGSIKNLYR